MLLNKQPSVYIVSVAKNVWGEGVVEAPLAPPPSRALTDGGRAHYLLAEL